MIDRKAFGAASMAGADIAAKVAAFIITPYLANRMGAAQFGSLSLYLATTDIVAFAIFLGGPALIAAEYVRNGENSALRLRAACINLSLRIAPLALLAGMALSWFVPSKVSIAASILIVLLSYLYGLNSLELSFYRGAQIYPPAVAGQLAFTALSVALTVAAFELVSPTATNRLLSIATALGLVQLAYAFHLHRRPCDRGDQAARRADTRLVITFGLSISVHVVSHWVRLSVDRFFLAGYAGLSAAGSYSVALQMALVPSIFFAVVSQQLQPYLYRRLRARRFVEFKKMQLIFTAAVVAFTLVYYWLLLVFFDRVFATEYRSAKALLLPLLAGSMAQAVYFVFSHAAFYERRGNYISILGALALAVHLLGLGFLVLSHDVSPLTVALVYLTSNAATAAAAVALSNKIVNRLASRPPLSSES